LPDTVSKPLLRFGPFELDLSSGELHKSGIAMRLQPQPAKVLVLLASRPGQLVTRDAIRTELWGDQTFVQFEQGLNFCVRQIRLALGDNADSPLYLETVPRRGYRFIAPVNNVASVLSPDSKGSPPVRPPQETKPRLARDRWPAVLSAVLVALALGLYAGHRWISSSGPITNGKVILAVLPFENMSSEPEQDYFSDGLTDEIITDLGQLQPDRLGVIARTSVMQYRHTDKTIRQIGRDLGADYILEGGVSHGTGELRVNAQLIQVEDQSHLWAQSFESQPGDVLKLQDQIAAKIANEIRLKLNSQQQARLNIHPLLNPGAYEAYLKGRYFWNRRNQDSYLQAIQYFQQALAKETHYAQAYAGLADCLALIGSLPDPTIPRNIAMPRAKAAAERALELDESSAEAHTSLAFVKMHYEWDWQGAESEYQRAVQLNPSYATAHEWHAYLLMAIGKKEASIAEISQARQLDPLSSIINTDLGELLGYVGDDDASIEQFQQALKIDPNFMLARAMLGVAYLRKGQVPKAIAELNQTAELEGGKTWSQPYLGAAFVRSGQRDEAKAIQRELERSVKGEHVHLYPLATLDAELGEKDKAFALLQESFSERQGFLILLKVDHNWDSLRSDPRYESLVKRVGLP